jgi:hypothetical protein
MHYLLLSRLQEPKDNCGRAITLFLERRDSGINVRALLSHNIRKNNKKDDYFKVTEDCIESILKNNELPNVFEQANNLILYIGQNSKDPAKILKTNIDELVAIVGCHSEVVLQYVLKHLGEEALIETIPGGYFHDNNKSCSARLTFKGWGKYEELKIELKDSKKAFMAMKFPAEGAKPPYEELQTVYKEFKVYVKQTGFELGNALLEGPKAGSIDNRLAVEIRKAKFLVADLSHDNSGAYWEAGFAQGLGKKVFYTCKKDDTIKTHFDTSHHTTIFWEVGKEKEAAAKLRDAIRNTFPGEAIMEDTK